MAYRKNTGRRGGSRARSYSRRAKGRTYKRAAGRSSSRRRSSGTLRRNPQTVKIVVEMAGHNPVARPAGEGEVVKPRKSKF